MFASSSTLTMKIVLVSCGIVSLAVALNYTLIPLIIHYLPTLWSVLFLMFKPPYLYLLLNGIIIVIVIISRFTHNHPELLSPPLTPAPIPPPLIAPPCTVVEEVATPLEVWDVKMPVVVDGLEVGGGEEAEEEKEVVVEEEDILPVMEKVEVLTSIGGQKKSTFSYEGRSNSSNKMRVAKHKRHETLDSIWRMITEGRNNNMNNTHSFENLENHTINSLVRQNSIFRKSATFKDRTNVLHEPPPSSGILLRKGPSLGKEELNLRVEAFIKKFNEEMRLQRQESLQRYMQMVNRGAN